MTTILNRLRSRSCKSFFAALCEAIEAGEEGDVALAEVLDTLPKDQQCLAAAALGASRGPAGPDAVRRVLHQQTASRNLHHAAMNSLAARCGVAAAEDFVATLAARDGYLQSSAVWCLAKAGDDRAWDQVFAYLQRHLRSADRQWFSGPGHPTEVLSAIIYLARHVGQAGSQRNTELTVLIRKRWSNLDVHERDWLEQNWPGVEPGDLLSEAAQPPDSESIRQWVCGPQDDLLGFFKESAIAG
jgi:hypothetical protein